MLRRFAVTGYRGFRDRTVLDLTSVRNYNFNQQCVKDGLIKTSLIVGKNACGKTNLGLALFDIVGTLTDKGTVNESIDESSFLNGFSDTGYAVFEYEFQFGDDIISYEYRKSGPTTIVYERMDFAGETVFERNGQTFDHGTLGRWDAGTIRMNIVDGPLSVLRYVVNNTVQSEKSPLAFVMDFVNHMLYFRSLQGNAYCGLTKGSENLEDYLIRNSVVGDFQRFLKDMADVEIDLDVIHVEGLKDVLVQKTDHKPIVFSTVSSSGTKSLLLLFYWMRHFDDVRFLYMDEFDAFYHYELAEKVLLMISREDRIQTILTSHNTSLLKNRFLRPDCCMKMVSGSIKSFADRTEREIREGHNLEKLYRGREFDE